MQSERSSAVASLIGSSSVTGVSNGWRPDRYPATARFHSQTDWVCHRPGTPWMSLSARTGTMRFAQCASEPGRLAGNRRDPRFRRRYDISGIDLSTVGGS